MITPVSRIAVIVILCLLAACTSAIPLTAAPALATSTDVVPAQTMTVQPIATEAIHPTDQPISYWISPAVPGELIAELVVPEGLHEVDQPGKADITLDISELLTSSLFASQWIYSLVAPFPTVTDDVAMQDLVQLWLGTGSSKLPCLRLFVSTDVKNLFDRLWGPSDLLAVEVIDPTEINEKAWETEGAWAIIPFEELNPAWKVIRVDGQSPLDQDFEGAKYPLAVQFSITRAGEPSSIIRMPETNRDANLLTSMIMTGTTALVRHTALAMEERGFTFPAQDIGSVLRSADITHISNEVPFYSKCPPAVPLRVEMRFCSDRGYIALLEDVGADVIELTGNHVLDWGPQAFQETIDLYRQHNLLMFGGGTNRQEAVKPLVIENHGNRIGLIGCNPAGPESILATDSLPGAAPCDLDAISDQISKWLTEGVIPIVTFQHFEVDDYKPGSAQRVDFLRMADAGAAIVSGSQAHFPQAMTFEHGAFVHYGLGNLFFDQMDELHRRSFIDRHYFYAGRYISTELLTTELEDYARPRWMTPAEREKFLTEIFQQSGWLTSKPR